jgi:hypothetical protein
MRRSLKMRVLAILATSFFTACLFAQAPTGITLEKVASAPKMQWECPEIEKYTTLLSSLHNSDEKEYAKNVRWRIDLVENPSSPNDKYIVTQALLKTENPLFKTENLLNHIADWIKKNKKWKVEIDLAKRMIYSLPSIEVARNNNYFHNYYAYIQPRLIIGLNEENSLLVDFKVGQYKIDEKNSSSLLRSTNYKVTEVFPFVEDSKYKNTCAMAYVNTYKTFWAFISALHKDLNVNFTRDNEMIKQLLSEEMERTAQLRYKHSVDSLRAKYGELTKVIAGQSTLPDINNEMRFYEDAQKLVFMGKTIDFKDIVSCEIVDDPQFVPGKTTSYGGGICFFGFLVGGQQTTKTADKTIHNYVVDVRIDNMKIPFIRIATGQDEFKAEEIASVFDIILRHQQSPKQKSRITRRTKR